MQTIAANDSNILFIGRWADTTISSAPAKVAISGGNKFQFRFSGTVVTLKFDPVLIGTAKYYPEIEYAIDGGSFTRAQVTGNVSVTGLSAGTHSIVVYCDGIHYDNARWSDLIGVRFIGLEINDGESVSLLRGRSKKILLIGDSIAEGQVQLAASNIPANSSGRLAFGNVLGAAVDADVWCQAFGGTGFTGTSYGVPATHLNWKYTHSNVLAVDPVFDAIIIEAGYNDGSLSSSTFIANYTTLINDIKSLHPRAHIICVQPLWGHTADVSTIAENTESIYVSSSGWTVSRPYLNHPDSSGHASMAGYLDDIIIPLLASPTIVTVNSLGVDSNIVTNDSTSSFIRFSDGKEIRHFGVVDTSSEDASAVRCSDGNTTYAVKVFTGCEAKIMVCAC